MKKQNFRYLCSLLRHFMQALSICISVYNTLVADMLTHLWKIASETNAVVEILLADDASRAEIRECNLQQSPINENIRWILLDENIGRAAIRNRLGKEAKYDWLLFIDCDVSFEDEQFISNYLKWMDTADVIVGGCQYHHERPSDDKSLRWTYGHARESHSAAQRSKNAYASFSSFNFCIRKKVWETCPFNESLKDYGHEDTLLGLALKKQGFAIQHIDNPLFHEGLDENQHYLDNSRKAVEKFIYSSYFQAPEIIASIRIWKVYHRLKRFGGDGLTAFIYRLTHICMEKQLCGKKPSMKLFDFYRLGYLCHYARLYKSSTKTPIHPSK